MDSLTFHVIVIWSALLIIVVVCTNVIRDGLYDPTPECVAAIRCALVALFAMIIIATVFDHVNYSPRSAPPPPVSVAPCPKGFSHINAPGLVVCAAPPIHIYTFEKFDAKSKGVISILPPKWRCDYTDFYCDLREMCPNK